MRGLSADVYADKPFNGLNANGSKAVFMLQFLFVLFVL